jgi:hypothetical protein
MLGQGGGGFPDVFSASGHLRWPSCPLPHRYHHPILGLHGSARGLMPRSVACTLHSSATLVFVRKCPGLFPLDTTLQDREPWHVLMWVTKWQSWLPFSFSSKCEHCLRRKVTKSHSFEVEKSDGARHPSNSGGRDQEDCGLTPAQANSLWDLILKSSRAPAQQA